MRGNIYKQKEINSKTIKLSISKEYRNKENGMLVSEKMINKTIESQ